jgi:hypothetical protein
MTHPIRNLITTLVAAAVLSGTAMASTSESIMDTGEHVNQSTEEGASDGHRRPGRHKRCCKRHAKRRGAKAHRHARPHRHPKARSAGKRSLKAKRPARPHRHPKARPGKRPGKRPSLKQRLFGQG